MSLILFSSLIAVSSAALLPTSYLPANPSSGVQTQGSGFQSQSFQSSQSSSFVAGGVSGDTGNRRPQQEVEKNAAILKLDQDANLNGDYHYSYETSNGIRAEETGNTVQSQGGFSYKGDDGITYTVTFTAGEGGFRPQGAHLPVAPPIPEDILKGLQQNERDEAAGIFDDGKYHPEKHGGKIEAGNTGIKFSGASASFGSINRQGSGSFNANTGYNY